MCVIEKGQKQGSTKRELAEARKGRTRLLLLLEPNVLEGALFFI